jgi:asparagine synthase (glutamine-hydrolysing)
MAGICLATGPVDSGAHVAAMLRRLAVGAAHKAVVTPSTGITLGWANHGRLPSEAEGSPIRDDVTVLVDGDVFDERGPVERPADVIADLYRDGRADRIAWLDGSFAAIIVDGRDRKIVLATDRLGSRSLFVWHDGRNLAAASRLTALLADDRVSRRLSTQGLVELLALQRTAADHTQYADIRAMTAAELWTYQGGSMTRRQSRRLAWTRPDFSEREGGVRLAEALTRAAARRTGDPVRHGILLSGGLDARLVLAAARKAGRTPPCLTAGPFRNAEVGLAEAAARRAGAPFRFLDNPPSRLIDSLDGATAASDGLFTAPFNLFGLLPGIARDHDVLLSGHGLDYTFRGYYLPCRMVHVAGSTTRLPRLRPIPDGTPETMVRNLRVGIKEEAVRAILRPAVRRDLESRKVAAMRAAIAGADIDNPYNAWDAYLLSCLGRHYAYSDFVAMESVIRHRAITFDSEVFDLYLAMPPEWRASGRMMQAAMIRLGPDLMALPDANTGIRASRPFPMQLAMVFARAALRRFGLSRAPASPEPTMTQGSWANHAELLRRDRRFVARLESLPKNAALLDSGLFEPDGLAAVARQHLDRTANHVKLLLQLLTMASWLEQHSYSGVTVDG